MARIALLVQQTPTIEDDNYFRIAHSLVASKHRVDVISIDSLGLINGNVTGLAFHWKTSFELGDSFPTGTSTVIDHNLVWLLSLGERTSFLDKYQLIYALPDPTQVINSLDAIMHLKSKYYLATRPDLFPQPETHASTDADELAQIVKTNGGRWIVKPPAGSLGRDVYLVDGDDTNLMGILQHMCGFDNTCYTLLQRYVPEIETGEKRVLLAAGKIIDQYQRFAGSDHRTNVSQGATTRHCSLTEQERIYCEKLATELLKRGVYFAGIDLAFPWLIETNVISPGGIQSIETLTGLDHTNAVVNGILNCLEF